MSSDRMRIMSHDEYVKHINKLYLGLNKFLTQNELRVDYIVPIMRSGAVPAVYLANKLNIVKFAPFQVKHIAKNSGEETIEMLFNPLPLLDINKSEPVFLIVEGTHATGASVELCIDEILKNYPKAKILYVYIEKTYGSKTFDGKVIYEDYALVKGNNLTIEECQKLNIDPYIAIYPWETMEGEIAHPDDLEDNIFF